MPSADAHPNTTKLVRLSRNMAWLTSAGMVAIVALMVLAFLIPAWTRNILLARLGEVGANLPLGPNQVLAAAAITAVPFSAMLWGPWNVRALFRNFAEGHAFSSDAARHLHHFGSRFWLRRRSALSPQPRSHWPCRSPTHSASAS